MTNNRNKKKAIKKQSNGMGWIITGVPGLMYTVGLTERYNHPEFMVQGLNMNVSSTILKQVAQRVADGASFADGELIPGIAPDGISLKTLRVDASNHQDWLAQMSDGSQALQVLWPDTKGAYPGESGYDKVEQWRFDVRRPEYAEYSDFAGIVTFAGLTHDDMELVERAIGEARAHLPPRSTRTEALLYILNDVNRRELTPGAGREQMNDER